MPSLLSVQNLTITRSGPDRWLRYRKSEQKVLDQISFDIEEGQCFGLVGERHSGKLALTKALLGLHPVSTGRMEYRGEDILSMSRKQLKNCRREMQVLFADEFSALNPLHNGAQVLGETLRLHFPRVIATEKKDRMEYALNLAKLTDKVLQALPDELDTEGRMRLALARALIVEPRLLICHDFTNGLDTPLQSSILNLLLELQDSLELSLLIVTHDLAIADHLSDIIAILHQGSIVEIGSPEKIVNQPKHNYTQKLVASTLTR